MEYLCACDLYCQPGKVSAIMENSVCARCPVMIYPHPDYINDYGSYQNMIWVRNEEEIKDVLRRLAAGEVNLAQLTANSDRCAKELLDYRKLAARIYR